MGEREEYKRKNLKLMACYFFALASVQALGIAYVVLFPSVIGALAMAIFLGTIWPILAYFIIFKLVFGAEQKEPEKA